MELLFSTLTGSRLYGTQTPTSDMDVKHIYLPNLNELLLAKPKALKNKVNTTNNKKNVRNNADDVDEEFISIQTFAVDFMMGQTYALELAFAVEGNHANQTFYVRGEKLPAVYDNDRSHIVFVKFVRQLREKFLTSNIKALIGYAVHQASLYSFKGERLNAVQEVCEFLETVEANVRLSDIADNPFWSNLQAKYPKYFKITTYDIGSDRIAPCFVLLEKTLPYTNSMITTKSVVSALKQRYGSRVISASVDNIDWKATMHAVRIVDEGIELLSKKTLEFPLSKQKVDYLLDIKHGKIPIEDVSETLHNKLEQLKQLEFSTDLREYNHDMQVEFDKWMIEWLRSMYSLERLS